MRQLRLLPLAVLSLGLGASEVRTQISAPTAPAPMTPAPMTSAPRTPTPAAPADPAVTADLTDLFKSFCIRAFPDDQAMDTEASARQATGLSPAQVARFLRADPGRGWAVTARSGPYIVTQERPPYRACAVRRMTPSGAFDSRDYLAAVQAYVAARGETLSSQPHVFQTLADGLGVEADVLTVVNPAGQPTREVFYLIRTNYHGSPPPDMRAEARGGAGVELRLVHQFQPSG
jgi:hypothetical protein